MPSVNTIRDAAQSYLAAGLCVLPAHLVEKRPAVARWKPYQHRLPTPGEVDAWFADSTGTGDAVCLICGHVSGNLEMIDFDGGGALYDRWAALVEAQAPGLLARLVVERSRRGGKHVFYRSQTPVCGNMKLAQRRGLDGKLETLIETRGEGGLFLCAPSPGYEILQGDPTDPPVLTGAERDVLLQAAWELNEYVPPVVNGPSLSAAQTAGAADGLHNGDGPSHSSHSGGGSSNGSHIGSIPSHNPHIDGGSSHGPPSGGDASHSRDVVRTAPSSAAQAACAMDNSHIGGGASHNSHSGGGSSNNAQRPGDDFNIRGDVRAVLQQHGWVLVRDGENQCWRRPGKDSGWSATLKDRVFYVFSSNSAPFEPQRAYSPFSVYTMLNYGGDFEQSARSLRIMGFGDDYAADVLSRVDLSGIMRTSSGSASHNGDYAAGHSNSGGCALHNATNGNYASHNPSSGDYATHNSNISGYAADNSHIGGCAADYSPQSGCATDYAANVACAADYADSGGDMPHVDDPGQVPVELLRIPGFISEVMDHCMAVAPYPNQVMAFCGAVALQSFLAARKVRDPGDNRTNLYLLGLAYSSAGKDHPRKINTTLLHEIGLGHCAGDKFASGEGIQDALFLNPAMLFQTDEVDTILQSISKSKDARHENLMGTLLTMYTSSASVYPMRRKAGKENPGVIDQPSLTLFGTAVPTHYYEALSARMLSNGFFARMIVLDAGPRGEGQEPAIRGLPKRLIETARWWADFQPGERVGNLFAVHPIPAIVPHTDEARALLIETRKAAEVEYSAAEAKSDEVGTTVWGRVSENTRKLALIYAVSENHANPVIGRDAVAWASQFVQHQTRRMLFMADQHVSEGEFDAECKRLIRVLQKWQKTNGDEWMPFWRINRKLPWPERQHEDVRKALQNQRLVEYAERPTPGTPQRLYRLL